ncbi:MAG: ADP-glyceromanno-heptose 6-epimerase [Dissulfurimicrobium sp.]|uniref:ADP-glyceromanno-heptose 6-epimerase n=1 Tax=Dissulfurimicrobium TaxID=1769732 RepID=UPI001EDB60DE|nr:ADP-glyceromanno-heptose 6-epimerase [Dissulfurimicrobium hydrothermale]UKL14119.1 ADP-glyceromanno-heptose 6-epimerase [Dissulfurimicrobium hydrothermale]
MILVTGGAGFIGSSIVWRLNTLGEDRVIIVDELGHDEKWKNLVGLNYYDFINKDEFIDKIKAGLNFDARSVIHMGANSSTTEKDADHLLRNNYEYTKKLAQYCLERDIRFIYASSAATYGDGSLGFDDSEDLCRLLRPLNMYGYSKNLFDIWAVKKGVIGRIVGLKYFNVFGPNEYHKGDMRSVVHKAFEQIMDTGRVKLFKSRNPHYKDGEQMRDFIYVKDAVDMTLFFLDKKEKNGLFNVGSGRARTWNDLVTAIFNALDRPVNIEYIDLPEHLAGKYQYFTEARLEKIKRAGYSNPITTLEDGVTDYVKNYLLKNKYFGF